MLNLQEDDDCNCASDQMEKSESDTLDIMRKFRRFYEDKLKEIDVEGGGDCLELKLKVQERWIQDLTAQTEMMAKIVKELENEATERVEMLEKKLQKSSACACEVMKRYHTYSFTLNLDDPFQKVFYLENDVKNLLEFIRRIRDENKWNIDGLQFYEVSYCDLFGKDQGNDEVRDLLAIQDHDRMVDKQVIKDAERDELNELSEELRKRNDEFNALKQSMMDMRAALTEEVAYKHDMISSLRKDVHQLEERCLQADKQTAFKDDIIKELRKEIKQLKQQLEKKCKEAEESKRKAIEEFKRENTQLLEKINKMKPSVKSACTFMDSDLISRKDMSAVQKEEVELEEEICRRQCEVEALKCRCGELEKSLQDAQGRADNLQKAVDLYLNSINVLEASEERAKIEIEQQRMTIVNLQEALISVKHELDELRDKNQQDDQNHQYLLTVLYVNIVDLESKNNILNEEVSQLTQSYTRLQDANFDLEVQHLNTLQDLAILETQLFKYQFEFKSSEDRKSVIKKLREQNRCYESVVECFKQEMAAMSEQLMSLQEILNLSNQSCKEETEQLYKTIAELQHLNVHLKDELQETQKQILLDNQMNHMKEAKMEELQEIILKKNDDLNMHDEAISEMKRRLEDSVMQNHELQNTIVSLNSTIMHLQCTIECSELEKTKTTKCQSQISVCQKDICDFRDDLGKRNAQLEKLQADYQKQHQMFKAAKKELEANKQKNREKVKLLKRQVEELKKKMAESEMNSQLLSEELSTIRNQTTQLAQRECCQEHELAQYKQIILELRQTLIELNENLDKSQLDNVALAEECRRIHAADHFNNEDIINCRCEIALYKKLVENFKTSLLESANKLTELESVNKSLCEEIKMKELKLAEVQKKLAKREKESGPCVKELMEKLRYSQAEEKRLTEFVDYLKCEVQKKMGRRIEECCANESDMLSTQEEINCLKTEIKKMIQNQIALNSENDKLLAQISHMQATIGSLEDRNRGMRDKVEKYAEEIQHLKDSNKSLVREKEKLIEDLQALQCCYDKLEKTHKYVKASVRTLEMELADARNNRDDICAESRCVVNNVKAWLEEQKKINHKVKKRAQCYNDTIERLKQENELLMAQADDHDQPRSSMIPTSILRNRNAVRNRPQQRVISDFPCGYTLGSQGTGSVNDRDSPSSVLTCSVEEWYSPNYRDDEETDDHDEDFIQRLEAITNEMRSNNMIWRNRCEESQVSKDDK